MRRSGAVRCSGNPMRLFDWRTVAVASASRNYDVSPDGQKFLIIKEGGNSAQASAPAASSWPDWSEELKQRTSLGGEHVANHRDAAMSCGLYGVSRSTVLDGRDP